MSPGFILMLLGGGVVLGIIGYTYHQGKQSCISYYEAQSLSNKLKNQQVEIKNYQDQQEYNEKLVGEADWYIKSLVNINKGLQDDLDKMQSTTNVCVSREFLRKLQQLRTISSQKNNS